VAVERLDGGVGVEHPAPAQQRLGAAVEVALQPGCAASSPIAASALRTASWLNILSIPMSSGSTPSALSAVTCA
jgi:hypothetical protein